MSAFNVMQIASFVVYVLVMGLAAFKFLRGPQDAWREVGLWGAPPLWVAICYLSTQLPLTVWIFLYR